MRFASCAVFAFVFGHASSFQIPAPLNHPGQTALTTRPLEFSALFTTKRDEENSSSTPSLLQRVWRRMDAIESAGLEDVRVAGPIQRIKNLHNPITYLVLGLTAGLKWQWCFRNPYYWFAVAFCVKWYRARYVFKIPVWDRQPNWNNIITSKEQEKDLKAFTCKNCGSTIFIAKTREFFFEGNTGIGGLGCFSCGAKGKENFVMDRDRIVEDVADEDDYFEYERPLDFVSRAERRKLLQEAGGSEDKANELLTTRTDGEPGEVLPSEDVGAVGEPQGDSEIIDAVVVEDPASEENTEVGTEAEVVEKTPPESEVEEVKAKSPSMSKEPVVPTQKKKKAKKTPEKKSPPPPTSDDDDDMMDSLGMDDF